MNIKKILLPVDGSDGSLIAMETARDLAKKFNAQIILLNVVEIGFRGSMYEFYAYDPAVEESLVNRGCRILDDTEARFVKSGYKAPIHSDRTKVTDEKNQTRYEYHSNINLDHGDLHHPASAGEDPQFEGTEFEDEVRKEQHHPLHETQIKEGKLHNPAGAGEDPDFEGTPLDPEYSEIDNDNKDLSGSRTDHPSYKKDKARPFTDVDTHSGPINNPQNMADQGYFNADVDPKLDSGSTPTPHFDAGVNATDTMNPEGMGNNYDVREPKSDHNSAVPERRGPVGVENSPRVNTHVSPELKGDLHPNQMNPNFVDQDSNANQMGLKNDATRHDTRGYENEHDVLREDAQLIGTQGMGYDDDIVIKKVSLSGQPGEVIVDFCNKHNIDLIVMATRGSSGMRRFFIGSVTNYVLHHSNVPLLAIPVKDDEKK